MIFAFFTETILLQIQFVMFLNRIYLLFKCRNYLKENCCQSVAPAQLHKYIFHYTSSEYILRF